MSKLWTFGDSLTDSFSLDNWSREYVKWKGYTPKVYGEIISDMLGFELVNLGKEGSDNYRILETICDNINDIKEDDYVIVGWSQIGRFRMVTKFNDWLTFIPNYNKNNLNDMVNVSPNTLDEIFYNRTSNLYELEVNSWIKIINKSLPNVNIVHWTFFSENINATYLKDFNRIYEETKYVIDDNHFSEMGQLELASVLLKKLEKNII